MMMCMFVSFIPSVGMHASQGALSQRPQSSMLAESCCFVLNTIECCVSPNLVLVYAAKGLAGDKLKPGNSTLKAASNSSA